MTRQEEIRNAIDTIIPILPNRNGRTYEQALMASGFEEGVKWADSNPKSPWISINDDLPCNHEELINPKDSTETILVFANIGGIIGITKMVKNSHTGEWIWVTRVTVYHWIPIPNLPKRIGG